MFTSREMAQIRKLELLVGKMRRGEIRGEREMARRGQGTSFREHRPYNEGDPIRLVDWNVFARMETYVIKEFEAEEALQVVLVQDCSASMEGAATHCARQLAAGIGVVSLGNLDRVRWIAAGGGEARGGEVFTGRARMLDLFAAVQRPVPGGKTDLLGAVRGVAPRTTTGGVAFVMSDFFDPAGATDALRYLVSRRYQVRAILIEDMERLEPPPLGRTRLRDVETGQTLTLEVTPEVITAYIKSREARANSLAAFCQRNGARFLRVRADLGFLEIVRRAIGQGWLTN